MNIRLLTPTALRTGLDQRIVATVRSERRKRAEAEIAEIRTHCRVTAGPG